MVINQRLEDSIKAKRQEYLYEEMFGNGGWVFPEWTKEELNYIKNQVTEECQKNKKIN